MSSDRAIATVKIARGSVPAPPSKSATQRAFVAAALATGRSRLRHPLLADDSRHLMAALEAVGITARLSGPAEAPDVEVEGRGGVIPAGRARLFVGNAGTAMRFLTAMLALGRGDYVIDGDERMRQRPIEDLLVALRHLGAGAVSLDGNGCPPVRVGGAGLQGGTTRLRGGTSSQYLSAILLAAPAAPRGTSGRVRVERLDPGSRQGDAGFVRLLERMGCWVMRGADWVEVEGTGSLHGIDADCGAMPDIVPTLAIVALFASGPTRITGVPHLKVKESDRIAALVSGIERLGGVATPAADGLTIEPRPLRGARVETFSDHRMAMAFAVAGLRVPGVLIADPGCVSKSFPGFWDLFDRLGTTAR